MIRHDATPAPVALSVLLDWSGSMMTIADDVVKGLNRLFADQRTHPEETIVTLAQFDSEDPFELLIDRVPLREVTDLDPLAYQPRGATPLFDAIGRLLSHIDHGPLGSDESVDHLVVIITDGKENASTEFGHAQIMHLIERKRKAGWVFAYLGSEPSSYTDAAAISVAPANARRWERTAAGTDRMMRELSSAVTAYRMAPPAARAAKREAFYDDEQP